MISIETIQEFVKNKSIIVICHGSRDESIINDYDVVIRISSDVKEADIWVNPFLKHHYKVFNVGVETDRFKYILRLNAERGGSSLRASYPEEFKEHTYFWNKEDHDNVAQWIGYLRPTTGVNTIAWLVKYTKPKEIAVVGMDFYKGSKEVGCHRPLIEKAFMEKLTQEYSFVKHL